MGEGSRPSSGGLFLSCHVPSHLGRASSEEVFRHYLRLGGRGEIVAGANIPLILLILICDVVYGWQRWVNLGLALGFLAAFNLFPREGKKLPSV